MKRIICLITALCIVLGSFSFCFADFGSTDSTNLYNTAQYTLAIKNLLTQTMPTFNQVSNISGNVADIYTRLGTLSTINTSITNLGSKLDTIAGYLHIGSTSISSLVDSILDWMSPIYTSINSIPLDLDKIVNGLWKPLSNGSSVAYLSLYEQALTNYFDGQTTLSQANRRANGHQNFFSSSGQWTRNIFDSNGNLTSENFLWQNGTPFGNIFGSLRGIGDSTAFGFNKLLGQMSTYPVYDDPDDYSSRYVSGLSFADTALDQLGSIDMFIARLGYVLASSERIEAQEQSAANEQAVVDNFIDSSGDGSATPSDIGSISDLSSGYKSNFGSDASVSGIFNIFNSNNMGWFSQETANQLDTTTTTRRGSSFDTPLLDQQINDIYDQIGVRHD